MNDKEKRFEKVAEVADGRIVSIDSDEMACLCEEDEAEISYECRTPRERAAKRLALAAFCAECGNDSKALSLYHDVLVENLAEHIAHPGSEESRFARAAYDGMSSLMFSNDEYVWESGGQTLADVREYFEKSE